MVVWGRLLHCNIGEVNIWQRMIVKDQRGKEGEALLHVVLMDQTKALAWELMGKAMKQSRGHVHGLWNQMGLSSNPAFMFTGCGHLS